MNLTNLIVARKCYYDGLRPLKLILRKMNFQVSHLDIMKAGVRNCSHLKVMTAAPAYASN